MSDLKKAGEKLIEGVTEGYEKIESGVVGSYKKVENAVVGGFEKITDSFVDKFLTRDGESVEDAKARLAQAQQDWEEKARADAEKRGAGKRN